MAMNATSRRDFLKYAGGAALGAAAVSGVAGIISCTSNNRPAGEAAGTPPSGPPATMAAKAEMLALPWPYKKIDPVAAAERAYQAYYNGGCMYGAFEGIVGELRQAVGEPFGAFPAAMTKYGAAGVSGWGTLCGALNGAAAAIFLVQEPAKGNPIINELFAWYGAEALPDYKPRGPKFEQLATSVAGSQLCHVSVTRWSEKSGLKTGSPERAERCAWITASTARYAVELLNKQAEGSFAVVHAVPAEVKQCISCHGKGGVVENVHASSQSSCVSCHPALPDKHPLKS